MALSHLESTSKNLRAEIFHATETNVLLTEQTLQAM